MGYWFYLILAGLCEIGFATFLKMSEQFTKLIPSLCFMLFSIASFYSMSKAIAGIPMQIVYPVWVGIGIVGISIVEIYCFNEPVNLFKIFCIITIVLCIFGLKMSS